MAKTALVTGASRGIGKQIAIALADAGFDVAVAARTVRSTDPTLDHSVSVHKVDNRPLPGSLEETAQIIEAKGRKALMVAMDLTDIPSVEAAIATVKAEWGVPDLIVHNGRYIGPGLMDSIVDTPLDNFRKFVEAHAIAPIRITQLTLPDMIARGSGTVITISSGAGTDWYPSGKPGAGAPGLGYRLGKASGHTLVGSILSEASDAGVRAFNLDPGFTRTERNEQMAKDNGFDPNMAAPAEAIAAVAVWMANDPASDAYQRLNNEGQVLALELSLYPDWRKG
jgi:NAD(P)-dependent dehydrogenase (short-subunit alcohol dehydrogenase family)